MRSARRRGAADGDAAFLAFQAATRAGASLIASGVGTSTASTRWTTAAPAGTLASVTLATAPESVLTATTPACDRSTVRLALGSHDLTVAPLVRSVDWCLFVRGGYESS